MMSGRERGRKKLMLGNSQRRLGRFVAALGDPKSLRDAGGRVDRELWEVRFEQMLSELHHLLRLARELEGEV